MQQPNVFASNKFLSDTPKKKFIWIDTDILIVVKILRLFLNTITTPWIINQMPVAEAIKDFSNIHLFLLSLRLFENLYRWEDTFPKLTFRYFKY